MNAATEKGTKMDKNEQGRIWKLNRGYAGKSRKWAYRRSKRAIRALREAGLAADFTERSELAPEVAMAVRK